MDFTLQIGEKAPPFSLCGTDTVSHNLKDFADSKALVVFFTCNHCPYVKASDPYILQTYETFNPQGVDFIAINSNSPNTHEEDSFENMVIRMEEEKFPWLYLSDQTQQIALAYGALRTPHFFVFDEARKLIYTGRALDDPLHPKNAAVNDLENALYDLLAGREIRKPLTNPIGCNIKWQGRAEHWVPPEACDLV